MKTAALESKLKKRGREVEEFDIKNYIEIRICIILKKR